MMVCYATYHTRFLPLLILLLTSFPTKDVQGENQQLGKQQQQQQQQQHKKHSQKKKQNIFQRLLARDDELDDLFGGIPTATLSNGVEIPLVGLGAGNMMPEAIPNIVAQAVQNDKLIRLIDTDHVSQTEKLVSQGIVTGVDELLRMSYSETDNDGNKKAIPIHVVTKIWYTHLGYERTKLSVQSSLDALAEAHEHESIDLHVHILIHWPRCYDTIEWMNCEQDEHELGELFPQIKEAGPPPHTDRDAYKESWKALEELYLDENTPIESIGVSNFHLNDLKELVQIAQVKPHIVQANVWSLLYDPLLVDFCYEHNIHIQAFHLLAGLLHKAEGAPFAYHHLLLVGNELAIKMREQGSLKEDEDLTAPQVVLAWLVQHDVGVLPRTANLDRLQENSAFCISEIPKLSEGQVEIVAYAVEALLSGKDFKKDAYVNVTFNAKSKDVYLYWADHEYGGEIQVAHIRKGEKLEEQTHPGHFYRIYDDEEKKGYELYIVEGKYGENHSVEL